MDKEMLGYQENRGKSLSWSGLTKDYPEVDDDDDDGGGGLLI
jgi:hypothetical protein